VTKGGTDPLLSKEDNITALIEPPTEEELDNAITGNMGHLMVVVSTGVRYDFRIVDHLLNNHLDESSEEVQAIACSKAPRAYGRHIRSRFTIRTTATQHEPHEQDKK
jgi:hypothetical protein